MKSKVQYMVRQYAQGYRYGSYIKGFQEFNIKAT